MIRARVSAVNELADSVFVGWIVPTQQAHRAFKPGGSQGDDVPCTGLRGPLPSAAASIQAARFRDVSAPEAQQVNGEARLLQR